MRFIVVKDNGTGKVPPREQWETIEAKDPRQAAIDWVLRQEGEINQTFNVLVMLEASAARGWAGAEVISLTLIRSERALAI